MRLLALMAGIIIGGVGVLLCQYLPSIANDRSFYATPDENDWPGHSLSEKQVTSAVNHFADTNACSASWRWALIGPNQYLLKGTSYRIVDVYGNPFIPNVRLVKGYWGSLETDQNYRSVMRMKFIAQNYAEKDCFAGIKP